MTSNEPKTSPQRHHRYETSVDIDLIGVNVHIHDVLDCYTGVKETIVIDSEGQTVNIEGSVRPNGQREVRVYKNGKLVKHSVDSRVIYDETRK